MLLWIRPQAILRHFVFTKVGVHDHYTRLFLHGLLRLPDVLDGRLVAGLRHLLLVGVGCAVVVLLLGRADLLGWLVRVLALCGLHDFGLFSLFVLFMVIDLFLHLGHVLIFEFDLFLDHLLILRYDLRALEVVLLGIRVGRALFLDLGAD